MIELIFTATIHQWLPLLSSNDNKDLIVNYLKELSARGLIKIYSFVIMPNHVHFIWQQINKDGKETPQGNFLKYTADEFLKILKQNGTSKLYEVNAANKKHEIWQRDSLSIEISSKDFAKQKIEYTTLTLLVVSGTLRKVIWIIIIHLRDFMKPVLVILDFYIICFIHKDRELIRVPLTSAQGIYSYNDKA